MSTVDIDKLIEQRVQEAKTKTKSDDEVVQIAWLARGIDVWYKTNGDRGNSPDDAERYLISSITRLLDRHTTHLKAELLAKLPMQHRNVGADIGDLRKKGYNQAITEITKIIEKEL